MVGEFWLASGPLVREGAAAATGPSHTTSQCEPFKGSVKFEEET